ncbi:MAG TPA: hypothetical protein VFY03_00450 [Woeseiaceae bacterium]|nr:hypothetical protein [Woeseiaceae bacterium]
MVRILTAALLAAALASVSAAEEAPARYSYVFGTDVSYVDTSGHPSWVAGSAGKLRYDADSDGLTVSRVFADYRLRIVDTLDLHVAAEAYDDDIGDALDFTQAYLEWRPLNLSPTRYRLRAGAFYPRLSLENRGPAWTSPYTLSSSAINTWIGEEIRVFGAELLVSRRPAELGGAHSFSVFGSAFRHNDPAGGLIAWKGWSVHDRQTRIDDVLPLPPLPQIQPDGWFWRQDPVFIPFQENDGDAGWYAGAEWQYRERLLLRGLRYDNRADPTDVHNGQYAWYTEFDALGLQAGLPGDVGLVAQWLAGETVMGPVIDGAHVVDNAFSSWFVLLTKAVGQQRFSARYERFDVTEDDDVYLDENAEDGRALTVTWLVGITDLVNVAAEWLEIKSYRPAWAYNDLATTRTERQLTLSVQLRFRN